MKVEKGEVEEAKVEVEKGKVEGTKVDVMKVEGEVRKAKANKKETCTIERNTEKGEQRTRGEERRRRGEGGGQDLELHAATGAASAPAPLPQSTGAAASSSAAAAEVEDLFGDLEAEIEEQGRKEGGEVKDNEVEDVKRQVEERKVEEVEEARQPEKARDPAAPTRAEWEAHQATHLPYRSWCRYCVGARGDNPPHRKRPEADIAVPEVHLDYCFVRRSGETELLTILVAKHRKSRAVRC